MINIDEKRFFKRVSLYWSIYKTDKNNNNNLLLGSVTDISLGGVGLYLSADFKPPLNIVLEIFPHPNKDKKNPLKLNCYFAWLDMKFFFHTYGYKFSNLTASDNENIDLMIYYHRYINRKAFLKLSD